MTDRGVAISTTGEEHRLRFLETGVKQWSAALRDSDAYLVITVDGTEQDAERAAKAVGSMAEVYRVGQPQWSVSPYSGRMGVAVNKNTGIELLMGMGVKHLFLSDDDTWPLHTGALDQHVEMSPQGIPHSMVCWGKYRNPQIQAVSPVSYATWDWPRGVVLYAHQSVVTTVGGMDERFGAGGHEHAEWSRRIHQHGLTPHPFVSPSVYARPDNGKPAQGARSMWHAEDMPRVGEHTSSLGARRRRITTIKRAGTDWERINAVMESRDGNTAFVPYAAAANGRSSATMTPNN